MPTIIIDIVMPVSAKVNVSMGRRNGINVSKTLTIKPETQVTASDILDRLFFPSRARFSTIFSVFRRRLYWIGEAPSISAIFSSIGGVLHHNPNGFLGFLVYACRFRQLCKNLVECCLIRLLA